MRRLIVITALIALPVTTSTVHAQGGPPLITDDPDTPGPGYWEINLSTFLERHPHSQTLELPRVDANYGVGRRIQVKLEAPWLRGSEDGQIRTGAGSAAAGVKYRFLGQEGQKVAWSVYPQIEFNPPQSSVTKGLVEDGRQFYLPTELTLEIFHLEVNGEVGRRFVQNGDDAWEYGISTEGHVAARLELLAEVHAESVAGARDTVIVNVGGRPKLTRKTILLFAAGRAVRGVEDRRPRLRLYLGLQFNLPGLYSFDRATASRGSAR